MIHFGSSLIWKDWGGSWWQVYLAIETPACFVHVMIPFLFGLRMRLSSAIGAFIWALNRPLSLHVC